MTSGLWLGKISPKTENMISALIGFVFLIAMTAGIAIVAAFLLDLVTRRMGLVLRSLIAGFIGGVLLMALPLAMFLTIEGEGISFLSILPMLVAGLLLMLLVGFPAAYFFGRRRQRARGAPITPETFE